ncbi:MAG: 30S ribosomal protein S11, partial [Puniceicoccaceae bacterium]
MSEEEKKEQIQEETPAAEKKEETPAAKKKEETPAAEKKEEAPAATAEDAKSEDGAEKPEEEAKPSQPTAADLLKSEVDLTVRKAKGSKNVTSGTVTILATFNNTKVTFSDKKGNVISWSSAGKMNFRGSRKSTAYAAQVVTQDAGKVALSHGMKEVEVRVKGPGMGRDSAIRAVQSLGMTVTSIVDITPVPHNGCRPK